MQLQTKYLLSFQGEQIPIVPSRPKPVHQLLQLKWGNL